MEIFKDDEGGYLRWVALNPGGFVLNCERRPSDRYLVLHRAICQTICSEKRTNSTIPALATSRSVPSKKTNWISGPSKRQVVGLRRVAAAIPDLVVLD